MFDHLTVSNVRSFDRFEPSAFSRSPTAISQQFSSSTNLFYSFFFIPIISIPFHLQSSSILFVYDHVYHLHCSPNPLTPSAFVWSSARGDADYINTRQLIDFLNDVSCLFIPEIPFDCQYREVVVSHSNHTTPHGLFKPYMSLWKSCEPKRFLHDDTRPFSKVAGP